MPEPNPLDAEPGSAAPDRPSSLSFDDRAGFVDAILAVTRSATRELLLADRDFSLWPIESPDGESALREFLRGGGRLRMLVFDPDWLDRFGARFARLRRTWSDRIECRAVPASARFDESFAVADRRHLARRVPSDALRGHRLLGQPSDAAAACQRFDALWDEAEAVLPPTTLGL